MIILLTKEVKKGDGDGVPVSRDQTWHRERETEESSDEEYHEISPLDWGYISSSLSSLRSNLWWREKWPLYWMLSDADSHSVTPSEWLSDRKTKMIGRMENVVTDVMEKYQVKGLMKHNFISVLFQIVMLSM